MGTAMPAAMSRPGDLLALGRDGRDGHALEDACGRAGVDTGLPQQGVADEVGDELALRFDVARALDAGTASGWTCVHDAAAAATSAGTT